MYLTIFYSKCNESQRKRFSSKYSLGRIFSLLSLSDRC
ncbi:rCG44484 [Rattus norvegicus]|uniref:RCG44484 n=1 Tax=Rattus norvegicus TaxID=10116 RepID=A6I4L0_RAT|nr:rCG44484 [Rattus norvegicus]